MLRGAWRVGTKQQVWCAGTYIIGCEQVFSVDNNVVITRMEDEGGAEWSKPVKLTEAREPVPVLTLTLIQDPTVILALTRVAASQPLLVPSGCVLTGSVAWPYAADAAGEGCRHGRPIDAMVHLWWGVMGWTSVASHMRVLTSRQRCHDERRVGPGGLLSAPLPLPSNSYPNPNFEP